MALYLKEKCVQFIHPLLSLGTPCHPECWLKSLMFLIMFFICAACNNKWGYSNYYNNCTLTVRSYNPD